MLDIGLFSFRLHISQGTVNDRSANVVTFYIYTSGMKFEGKLRKILVSLLIPVSSASDVSFCWFFFLPLKMEFR